MRRRGLLVAGLAVAAVALAWAAGGLRALESGRAERKAREARERIVAEAFAPVLAEPALERRAAGLSPDAVQQLLFELSRDGLPRLPDETLLERLELLRTVAAGGERPCALVLRGGGAGAAEALVAGLDEATLRRWLSLSAEAVRASLRDDPPRALAQGEADAARAALLGAMAPADAERFVAALGMLEALDDREACRLARAALDAAVRLEPAPRRLVARLLASG